MALLFHKRIPLGICAFLTFISNLLGGAPAWWTSESAIVGTADDSAAATQGQVMAMVKKAKLRLDVVLVDLGGAGTEINQLLTNYNTSSNSKAAKVGQVKHAASLFWKRLQIVGAPNIPSWPGWPYYRNGVSIWTQSAADDDDNALASLGQVKTAFSFDIPSAPPQLYYYDGDSQARFWGNPPLTTGGYILTGLLAGNQTLEYGSGKMVELAAGTVVSFVKIGSSRFVTGGTLSVDQTLDYASGSTVSAKSGSNVAFVGTSASLRYVDRCVLASNQLLNYGSGKTVNLALGSLVKFEYMSGSTTIRYVQSGTLSSDQTLDYSSGATLLAKSNTYVTFTGTSASVRYVDSCVLAGNQPLLYGSGKTVNLALGSLVKFEYMSGSTTIRYVQSGILSSDQTLDYSSGATLFAKTNTEVTFVGSSASVRYVNSCILAGNQPLLYGSGKSVILLGDSMVSFYSISTTLRYVATGTLATDQTLEYSSSAPITAKSNTYVTFTGTSASVRYVDSCVLAGNQPLLYGSGKTVNLALDSLVKFEYMSGSTTIRYVQSGILSSDQTLDYSSGATLFAKTNTEVTFVGSSASVRYVNSCILAGNQPLLYGSGKSVILLGDSMVSFYSISTTLRYVATGTLATDQTLEYSSSAPITAKANTYVTFTGTSASVRYVDSCVLAGNQPLLYGSGKSVILLGDSMVSFYGISTSLKYVATGTLATDQTLEYSNSAPLTAKANTYVTFTGSSASARYVDSCVLSGNQSLRYGYHGSTLGYVLAEFKDFSTARFYDQYVSEGTLSIDQDIYYGNFGAGRIQVSLKASTLVRFDQNYVLEGTLSGDQDLYYRSGALVRLKTGTPVFFKPSSSSSYHYVVEGRLADAPATQTINYAFGLTVQLKAGTMVYFAEATGYVEFGIIGSSLTINDINSGTTVVIAAGYGVELQSSPAGTTGSQLPPPDDDDGDGWPNDIDPTPGFPDPDPNKHGIPSDVPANVLYTQCVGDAMQGIEVLGTPSSLVIPKGSGPRFVKLAIQTDEFPEWTSDSSQYNDMISWEVSAPGQPVMSGNTSVNSLHYQLNSSFQSGTSFFGYSPVVVIELGTIFSDPSVDKTVNVSLKVTNVSDGALPTTAIAALLPIDIEEVISDQIAGNEANKLPSPYFGGNPAKKENGFPNNPMLMATRTGSDARLMIKMNVPAAQAASIRVGVREAGQTTILNSAASVAPPAKTPLSFTALSGAKLYEVVAGYDANGNSVLENSEVAVVFEKTPRKDKEGNAATANLHLIDKFRVVTQDDFNAARTTTDNHADGFLVDWLDSAEGLLKAFAIGGTSVPGVPEATTTWGHVLIGSPSPSPQGLSHPVGATWTTPANNSTTLRFEWPTGSDLSEDVVGSDGLTAMIKRLLVNQKAALAAVATATESVVTLNALTDDGINFRDTDKYDQVHVALGACKFEGGMQVKVKQGTGTALEVSAVNCWGALFDLYDWTWDAPQLKLPFTGQVVGEPREAAKVQAGFATLAASTSWPSAGRVFFTKVNFGTGWIDLDETIP